MSQPRSEDPPADWEIVDAFLSAARGGDFARLVQLLAPDVTICGDAAAVAMGTPELVSGRRKVAEFFNGAAKAALPRLVQGRPGAAWIHRGEAKVAFDFTVANGLINRIEFRADPGILAEVSPR